MSSDDLPFRAEYAKSNRAGCKKCKEKIDKGELRLAVMVQSPMFDGKQPNWHHVKCFFTRSRPKAVGDIGHFDQLRWEDQEKLTKMVAAALEGKGPSGGKGSGGLSASGTLQKDFRVELAKTGAAKCRICEDKIAKGIPRISKKDYDSDRARMYGPQDRWHHVECFAKNREELEFFDAGESLSGFGALGPDHKELIRSKLPKMAGKRSANGTNGDAPAAKKAKTEESAADAKAKEEIKKQMKKLYYYRDMLERNLGKNQLTDLLTLNGQEIPSGVDKILDRLSDAMMFGALKKCPECENGQLVFRSGVGYQCTGDVSEWTKCQYRTTKPERVEFKLPADYKKQFDFCKLYKSKVKDRIVPNTPTTIPRSSSQESLGSANGSNGTQGSTGSNGASKSGTASLPLKNLAFVLEGKVDKEQLKKDIEKLGGRVSKTVRETTAAVISDEATLNKMTKTIAAAKESDVHVVSADVLDNVKTEGIIAQIKSRAISEWGSDPKKRIGALMDKAREGGGAAKSGSMYTKEVPKSMTLKLKGGAYVDPESGLEDKAHVYKSGEDLYSVVLGSVDVQEGRNSYYKLQLLQHDTKAHKFYVFRSWGRVGTTIGGTKLEDFGDLTEAKESFKFQFADKTGNRWSKRKEFAKKAGKMQILDMDLGGGEAAAKIEKLNVEKSKSKLAKPIQELIALIFDIEVMKKAMVEFEIDLTKMPLGKLSKKQIRLAYKILTEVQEMIKGDSGTPTKFLDASNRFFTLIPHDFGMKSPPLLDNPDFIRTKIDMLDNLLEIEVAYNLLQTADEGGDKGKDAFDAHYEKLKTDITVLDRESSEFKTLEKYVKNTHASTHNLYKLRIEQIFKISRHGEGERFRQFSSLDNRTLLWHGSRTTNFAGILSQGLRIAPPEAPVTGYMFGKGIYFADMVSKSANYCNTTRSNNTGLLLLCDVALGNMYERKAADYIEKLPAGKHSTKGLGKTHPDPEKFSELGGARVPHGKGVAQEAAADSTLLYNEYIIYDVAQCNAKYLFRMKFDYKL